MTRTRKWSGPGAGVAMAAVLSGLFVGLTALASLAVAAAVVVPLSLAVGAARARAIGRATPHSLVAPTFEGRPVVDAPRASAVEAGGPGISAA